MVTQFYLGNTSSERRCVQKDFQEQHLRHCLEQNDVNAVVYWAECSAIAITWQKQIVVVGDAYMQLKI